MLLYDLNSEATEQNSILSTRQNHQKQLKVTKTQEIVEQQSRYYFLEHKQVSIPSCQHSLSRIYKLSKLDHYQLITVMEVKVQ
jgi:uncharacterized protein with NAD-binding domain and iron-sulfur cluster